MWMRPCLPLLKSIVHCSSKWARLQKLWRQIIHKVFASRLRNSSVRWINCRLASGRQWDNAKRELLMLDLAQPKDALIDQRLRSELIICLSTVRPDGRPHRVPVWFLWDGATFLIFSQPKDQKLRNLRHNPNVVLSLIH